MQIKEKKEMDDAFKKAQKPWAKFLHKVNKSKSDYHNACKSEKSAINMERNASGDSSVSEDHVRANSILLLYLSFGTQNRCSSSSISNLYKGWVTFVNNNSLMPMTLTLKRSTYGTTKLATDLTSQFCN